MSDFGKVSGYEVMKYAVEIPRESSPHTLIITLIGSEIRDFALILDTNISNLYTDLSKFPFSSRLDAKYCYVGGDLTYIQFGQRTSDERTASTMEVALVRWNRKSTTPFPRTLHCVANVRTSVHGIGKNFNEIISVVAVPMP